VTQVKVDCVMGHQPHLHGSKLVIDDSEGVYRFTCTSCGTANEKVMSDRVRELLRDAQTPTVEELVSGALVVLQDDKSIWDALDQA